MFKIARIVLVLLFTAPVLLRVGTSAAQAPSAAASPTSPPPSAIEPKVLEMLKPACLLLSSAKTVSYHAEITFDSVLPSHVKLQYAGWLDAAIERPNRFALKYGSDLGAKQLWYDGSTLTIFDPPHMAFASTPAADTLDQMMAQVAEEKNLTIPLAGLDYSHPCERVRDQILAGKYVGLNDVGGVNCDHLAFIQEQSDWQLWIEHGKNPLPLKIVITYKDLPTQPQWQAVLSKWRFDEPLAASLFQPKIPPGAIKADFLEIKREDQK